MITATAVGRLVRDPELQFTRNGTPLCRFRLACDRARGREGASFLDVVVWGTAGEANAEWLRKGRQVAVAGNLEHQQWQTADGNYRERYELNADHITWLAAPRDDTEDGRSPNNSPEPGPTADTNPEPVTSQSAPTTDKATAKKATAKKAATRNGTARKAAAKAATGEEPF